MPNGTLTIYNASAGSGKTHTLTGIYLSSLFRSRYNYRKILAVTFTNKATAEMKSRILGNLHRLSIGENCEYLDDLMVQTGKTREWIAKEAGEILNAILHDFSRFSVSTIDSFFQKIIRAFAREAGLHSGFNVELDHEIWLSAAIDDMISSASENRQLKDWLIKYAISNIDNEKSWNLRGGITHLSGEIFKEKFKILSKEEMPKLRDKEYLTGYITKMKCISSSFEKFMKESGQKAMVAFASYQLSDDMFFRKGQGIPGFVKMLAAGEIPERINDTVRSIMSDEPRWCTGKMSPQLAGAIAGGLDSILMEAIAHYDRDIIAYRTAKVIVSNIYALGILSDVLQNIHRLTSSENTFLLSDAGDFLRLITEGDQCPFIYEKVGNRYENFMIDEFQDTSTIQWKNFYHLIENSRAQGNDNLVVGDIKQSIYRWRNSDWKILRDLMESRSHDERIQIEPLAVNWRSCRNIIKFNNDLFSVLPSILDEKIGIENPSSGLASLYHEAVQQDPGKKEGGFVKIEFVTEEPENCWEDKVLTNLTAIVENLQDKGFSASDIGVIVRSGNQGAAVLKHLIDYGNNASAEKRAKYCYNAVSNDSLLLSGSAAVNFIISVISVVNDPADMISGAAMIRHYLQAVDDSGSQTNPDLRNPEKYFPQGYGEFFLTLVQKPLFESIESIIKFFSLGDHPQNAAWLSTFQDCVLAFTRNGNPDPASFLEWWHASGYKKSVVLPGNQEAIRILTIHKSKGLEFRVVILPFINWELDHPPLRQPLLWVKPQVAPFDELGVLPVRCSKELAGTFFSDYYNEERYSVHLDNLNLLYVAATRAKDVLYGFAPASSGNGNIASVLREALSSERFSESFDVQTSAFECGDIPERNRQQNDSIDLVTRRYPVTHASRSLKLKLHGENYFSAEDVELRRKINYGKLMHEVFEGIDTPADIPGAVRRLVIDGKLPADEASTLETKISSLVAHPEVAPWFAVGNTVLKEAGILLTSGNIRRPDRVILRGDKATVIDFKFGEENDHYAEQVGLYRSLLIQMGHKYAEGFIWYVNKNRIVPA